MGGLMNNYFYGKAGKGDYTVEQMPTTRRQLFFTTLRVRLSSMMGLNFFHLIFCLPLLFWVFLSFQTLNLYSGEEAYKAGSPAMETAYMEMKEAEAAYLDYSESDNRIKEATAEREKWEAIDASMKAGNVETRDETVVDGGEPVKVPYTAEEVKSGLNNAKARIDQLTEFRNQEGFEENKTVAQKLYEDKNAIYENYRISAMKSNIFTALLIMIPLMGIAGIGSTGQMYVLRNWARDEHSFMWQDYKQSIRNNWKQGLLVGILNGASLLVFYVAFDFYGQMAQSNSVFFLIPRWLMVMFLIIWWMMNEVIFPMMVTYDFKIKHLVRNSFIMVVARLPLSFLVLLGSVLVPAVLFMLTPFGPLVLVLLYALIGFSLTGFVYASYANSLFDKYLNPRIEGAEVNKGLRALEDDDDEDEPEAKPAAEGEPKEDRFWERKS